MSHQSPPVAVLEQKTNCFGEFVTGFSYVPMTCVTINRVKLQKAKLPDT